MFAVVTACSVPDLDATGKRCPCGDGAVCDPCTNSCVPEGALPDSCDDDPLAAVQVSELLAEWSTPNQIRWSWTLGADDDPDKLVGYRLVVARSEADLLDETGSALVFSEIENPELRGYFLRHTDGLDPVTSTLTDGLEPDVVYFARLQALDTAGRVASTNVAQHRTQEEERGEHIVFDVAPVPEVEPPDLTYAASCTDGSGCYRWTCVGEEVCYDNLRLRDGSIVLNELVTEGRFNTTAFVEFVLELEGSPSDWSDLRVWLDGEEGPHVMKGITYRSTAAIAGPRTYQIPLRVLIHGGEALSYEMLDQPLYETGVGLSVDPDATATIHRVRVAW